MVSGEPGQSAPRLSLAAGREAVGRLLLGRIWASGLRVQAVLGEQVEEELAQHRTCDVRIPRFRSTEPVDLVASETDPPILGHHLAVECRRSSPICR